MLKKILKISLFVVILTAIIVVSIQFKEKSDFLEKITVQNVIEKCPHIIEQYVIPNGETRKVYIILRLRECMGVDDMFTVGWHGENLEVNNIIANLHVLLYQKERNVKLNFLKSDSSKIEKKDIYVKFYEVNSVQN